MKTASLHSLSLFFFLLGAHSGCSGGTDKSSDDTSGPTYWCESLDDAQSYYIEDGGGNISSGRIEGRVITSSSDDIHDVNLVGDLDFTLQNATSGGSPSLGATSEDGDFSKTVGEGTWELEASKTYMGKSCTASYQFEVVAAKTTYICVDLTCE